MSWINVKVCVAGPKTGVPAEAKRQRLPHLGRRFLAGLVYLVGFLAPSYAGADEFVSDDWQFQLAPYAWALAADGDVTVKGQKSDVSLSFKDIVEELNYGAMLEGEARKGRVGVVANILYANLGDEESVGGTKIDPDVNLVWGAFAGFYRLGPWNLDSEAGADGPQLIVDPYAGLRYTYLDVDLDIGGGPDLSGDEEWVDPIVGLRTLWQLTPRWGVTAAGDIGGFGVGSDFQWMATGLIRYRFGLFGDDNAQFGAGYRALYQDYSDGSGADKFEWDVILHGPVFALGIEF